MKKTTQTGLLASIALMLSAGAAQAAPTIALDGSGDYVVGDIVTFTMSIDFSGDPTLGGGIDVMWDAALLGLVAWNPIPIGDPDFAQIGAIGADNIDGFAFGDFAGLEGPADVATISFEMLAAGSTLIDINDDSDGAAGPFVSSESFEVQDVEFQGAALNIAPSGVPVPAALWLLFGGLGALAGFGRKKTS